MIYKDKYKIIDNLITACDYNFVIKEITKAIKNKKSLLISPIASHTLVRAHYDENLRKILNKFDYLVPDSQWVRWSIPFLYGKDKNLKDRVYGPDLMLKSCKLAEKNKYRIFLYGNTQSVLNKLKEKLQGIYPKIKIVGEEASKFRELTEREWRSLTKIIISAKSNIIFISLGSPKQEVFSFQLSKLINKPMTFIPIGAAFDFISGNKKQAPGWIQNAGLEWILRLISEPKRLYKRYLLYAPLFIFLVFLKKLNLLTKKYAKNN